MPLHGGTVPTDTYMHPMVQPHPPSRRVPRSLLKVGLHNSHCCQRTVCRQRGHELHQADLRHGKIALDNHQRRAAAAMLALCCLLLLLTVDKQDVVLCMLEEGRLYLSWRGCAELLGCDSGSGV